MSAGPLLARGRRAARRDMTDMCTISRRSAGVTNTTTGAVEAVVVEIYAGCCKVQEPLTGGDGTESPVAAADVRLLGLILALPVPDSAGVRAGDEVVITAARNDLDLVGRVYSVTGESAKTAATARRLRMQEVTG